MKHVLSVCAPGSMNHYFLYEFMTVYNFLLPSPSSFVIYCCLFADFDPTYGNYVNLFCRLLRSTDGEYELWLLLECTVNPSILMWNVWLHHRRWLGHYLFHWKCFDQWFCFETACFGYNFYIYKKGGWTFPAECCWQVGAESGKCPLLRISQFRYNAIGFQWEIASNGGTKIKIPFLGF